MSKYKYDKNVKLLIYDQTSKISLLNFMNLLKFLIY